MTALDIAQAIRTGELSSLEATRYFLERAQADNDRMGAFALITERKAIRQAKKADARRAKSKAPERLPLFHGVPSAVKDLVPTRGIRTQLGSRAYAYFIPPFDGAIAQRMKDGGLVSIGKLATSELGVMPITENDVGPPVRNPWCPQRNAGGSSGGSGAAMAAGLIPIAHASDGGGSIRIPAAFCHRYGFKPSLSLLGNLHGQVNRLGLSVMGPIAYTVQDAAAMLDVMAGRPHGGASHVSCLKASQSPPPPLRIGVCVESAVTDVHPEHQSATHQVADTLRSLGHTVQDICPIMATVDEFLPIWQYMIAQVPVFMETKLQPITQALRRSGREVTYARAKSIQKRLATLIQESMSDIDILLTPTTPGPPPLIGEFSRHDDPMDAFHAAAPIGSFTALFNLTQGPAASHPVTQTKEGTPIGVQLGAKPGYDHLLLSLSAQLESALPTLDRFPKLTGA